MSVDDAPRYWWLLPTLAGCATYFDASRHTLALVVPILEHRYRWRWRHLLQVR